MNAIVECFLEDPLFSPCNQCKTSSEKIIVARVIKATSLFPHRNGKILILSNQEYTKRSRLPKVS
jgi:hypothetical protein